MGESSDEATGGHPMKPPFQYPEPHDEQYISTEEFQKLSSSERFSAIAAVIEGGWKRLAELPNREEIERYMDEQETEWQRIQSDLFRRFGPPSDDDAR
jgi:hypothetical protein